MVMVKELQSKKRKKKEEAQGLSALHRRHTHTTCLVSIERRDVIWYSGWQLAHQLPGFLPWLPICAILLSESPSSLLLSSLLSPLLSIYIYIYIYLYMAAARQYTNSVDDSRKDEH